MSTFQSIPPEFDSPAPTSMLSGQMVILPASLASRLFHCYYGAGPRFYESTPTAELVPADELRALRTMAVEYARHRTPAPTPSSTPPKSVQPSYPSGIQPQGVEATNPMGT